MTSVFIEGAEAYREALQNLTRLGHDDRIPEELQDAILREVRKLRSSTVHDAIPDFELVKEIERLCIREGTPYAFSGTFALNVYANNVAIQVDRIEVLVERLPPHVPPSLKEAVVWQVANTDRLAIALQERTWEYAGSLAVPVVSAKHLRALLPKSLRPYLP